MGLTVSRQCNPFWRDQAINKGLFPKISESDSKNPFFTQYDIRFKEIKPDQIVFDNVFRDRPHFTNEDLKNTVTEISFSRRCKLVPDSAEFNTYHLVDASYEEPKKLISVHIQPETIQEKYCTYQMHTLKYQIHG